MKRESTCCPSCCTERPFPCTRECRVQCVPADMPQTINDAQKYIRYLRAHVMLLEKAARGIVEQVSTYVPQDIDDAQRHIGHLRMRIKALETVLQARRSAPHAIDALPL